MHSTEGQPKAHLDVMPLWDNNVLMGEQVLEGVLGDEVLNLQTGIQTQERPSQPLRCSRAGSCLPPVPVST